MEYNECETTKLWNNAQIRQIHPWIREKIHKDYNDAQNVFSKFGVYFQERKCDRKAA